MKTMSYLCDCCKKSVSKEDLVEVKVEVGNIFFNNANIYDRRTATIDYCKDCLKKKGFEITEITKENRDEIATKNTKTLASKIIDILEDLDVAFCE